MRTLVLIFSTAVLASAQIVSFGVKGGVPLTQGSPYDFAGLSVDTGRWTVGPTVELHLPAKISLEFDALYRRYSVTNVLSTIGGPNTIALSSKRNAGSWDFPLLLKYRFSEATIRPFVDAGVQYTYEASDFSTRCSGDASTCAASFLPSFSDSLNRAGPVAGAGIEVGRGKLRLAPEVRYTRLNKPGANQVTLLVGLTF